MANNRLYLRDRASGEEIQLAKARVGDDAWDWPRTSEEMTAWLDGRDTGCALGPFTELEITVEIPSLYPQEFAPCRICRKPPYTPTPVDLGDHQHHQVICLECGIEVTLLSREEARVTWNKLMA